MTTKTKPNTPATKPQRKSKTLIMARSRLADGPRYAAIPAEPAKPPLMSDPRHVTPVAHDEPYATWHRAGMADPVPTTLMLPTDLGDMLRHAIAWVPPEGVTHTITVSLDHGLFTVGLDCEGYQPEEGVEFHVALPSDGECIFQVLDEAADEVLVAMGRPPARTCSKPAPSRQPARWCSDSQA